MKTATKILLWINIEVTAFFVLACCGDILEISKYYFNGQYREFPELKDLLVMTIWLLAGFVALLVFNANTLYCVSCATTKSEIKIWRIVLAFLLSNVIVGILLCCMDDNDFMLKYARKDKPSSPLEKLEKYNQMLNEGMINEEQYKEIKQQLLK